MKIVCVCKNCAKQTKEEDDVIVEINFLDGNIYFYCPYCQVVNKLEINKPASPLPKTRRL